MTATRKRRRVAKTLPRIVCEKPASEEEEEEEEEKEEEEEEEEMMMLSYVDTSSHIH